MRTSIIALVAALSATQASKTTDFVGTMPCGEAVRAFVGGVAPGAPCHAISLQLKIRAGRWTLDAAYTVPAASDPNAMVDGPRISLEGALERATGSMYDRSATVYRMNTGQTKRSLSFVEISDAVLHAIDSRGNLMVGTDSWSYTLYRTDRVEPPPGPEMASNIPRTVSPRASGPNVFGVFVGRSPCARIGRELTQTGIPGCPKVKWVVTLFQDPASKQPTTYRIESTIHRAAPREGRWRNGRGIGVNPDAGVFLLDGTATEGPIFLLRGSNDVLFFLDSGRTPLVGTKDFSYTLNRDSF